MNSLFISIFTDEDVYGSVARTLRDRGYDAISAPEAQTLGKSDGDQLSYAATKKRAILTFNVRDFVLLHKEYIQSNQGHYGIIVSKRLPIGSVVKGILNLLNIIPTEDMMNRLEYLTDWLD